MKLHELADRPGARKKRSRIGRGIGSGTGKTGGRGGKGQTARSGVRIKGFEGGQMPLHRRLPKRGFKNTAFAIKLNEVNLGRVQAAIDAGKLKEGATVHAEALVKAEVLRRAKDGGRLPGAGEIKAKIDFAVWGARNRPWPQSKRRVARSRSWRPSGRSPKGPPDPYRKPPPDPHIGLGGLSGRRDGSFTTWHQQRNNWRPISTSRRSPRRRS